MISRGRLSRGTSMAIEDGPVDDQDLSSLGWPRFSLPRPLSPPSRQARPLCGSVPTPTTCRSPTRRARVSRTSSPSSSRRSSDATLDYSWFPEATGYVPNTMGQRRLRFGHGLRPRHRADRGHQPLLLHLLCADLPRGRREPRLASTICQTRGSRESDRSFRPHPAGEHPRHAWAGGNGQAVRG